MKYSILCIIAAISFSSCSMSDKDSRKEDIAKYIETEEFSSLNLPFSQAVQYGNIIYVSGQVGDLEETGKLIEGGIIPETKQAMTNIKRILEQNGSSTDNIIKCTCMLDNIEDWSKMSAEYLTFFPDHKPARSAFATNGLALNAKVEIECMAYVKK